MLLYLTNANTFSLIHLKQARALTHYEIIVSKPYTPTNEFNMMKYAFLAREASEYFGNIFHFLLWWNAIILMLEMKQRVCSRFWIPKITSQYSTKAFCELLIFLGVFWVWKHLLLDSIKSVNFSILCEFHLFNYKCHFHSTHTYNLFFSQDIQVLKPSSAHLSIPLGDEYFLSFDYITFSKRNRNFLRWTNALHCMVYPAL